VIGLELIEAGFAALTVGAVGAIIAPRFAAQATVFGVGIVVAVVCFVAAAARGGAL
jgi:hypothetical protein